MRRGGRVLVLALLAALVAGCTSGSPERAPEPRAAPEPHEPLGVGGTVPPTLRWSACGGGFQCATARVPLDYDQPDGRTIELALTRLPARDPGALIGPLFVNYGGPGTEAIGELTEHAPRFPASLRRRFDLVAVDPRGVGASTGLDCWASGSGPVGSPIRDPQRFFDSAAATGRLCARTDGSLLPHLSSANSARDMELLRRALGERRLNFLGYSYGTYLGATYANLFPEHTRAMVFDGALNLVANAAGQPEQRTRPVDVRADVAGAQREELDAFFAACEAAGPRCAFSVGDPAARFADLVAALKSGRGGPTGLSSLFDSVDSGLQSASRFSRLAETLRATYDAVRPPSARGGAFRTRDPYVATHSAGFLATQCVDSDNPRRRQDYLDLAASEDSRHPYFGMSAVFNMAGCVGWPARDDDRYLGPWNAERQHPILVVNNRYDPATPLRNARATVRQLGDAGLLTVDGFGHTSLNVPSRCAERATAEYLVTAELPKTRSCEPDTRPFS